MTADLVFDRMAALDPDEDVEISADGKEETVDVKQYSVSGYGADFDVEGLVRRLNRGDIEIPEFQRTYVWSPKRASRFVESLLIGLPVPGIFLYRDTGSQSLRVIDGQQRLVTLKSYYGGRLPESNNPFRLSGLESRFNGLAFEDLQAEDKRRLNDSIIHASIIQQLAPDDHGSSQFALFDRLNTTSSPLSPQEIRAAIYGGKYNTLLEELNTNKQWRKLFGKVHSRKRDQEMILRFLALYFQSDKYRRPMKGFMNEHMSNNRDLELYSGELIRRTFECTVGVIFRELGVKAFKPRRGVNAALLDAIMVGIGRCLAKDALRTDIRFQYDALLENSEFIDAISAGTSQDVNVENRLRLATEAFDSTE